MHNLPVCFAFNLYGIYLAVLYLTFSSSQEGGNHSSYQQGITQFKPGGSQGSFESQQINGAQRNQNSNSGQSATSYYSQQQQTDPYQKYKQGGGDRQQVSVTPTLSQHAPLQSYNTSQLIGNLQQSDGAGSRTSIGFNLGNKNVAQVPLHGSGAHDYPISSTSSAGGRRVPGVASNAISNHQYVPPAKRETTPTQQQAPKRQIAIPKLWNQGETPRAGYAGSSNVQNLPQYQSNGMHDGSDTSYSDSMRSEPESPFV